MANHHDDAVYELVERAFGGSEGLAGILRDVLRDALQQLIEEELTTTIGAAPHERSESRTNWRNGHRERLVSTPAGDVELRIPKVREGSFFPSLLEPRRRVDKALWAVIMTAYITGTSTRKVDDLVRALGCETGISKSTVSRICKEIDAQVAVIRERRLDHTTFPYVWVDATYVKARWRGQVVSRAVVIAVGVNSDGNREVLGVDVGDSEDEVFWTAFLRALKERGLGGVRLVTSDCHAGLKRAIERVLQGAAWQRCRVHLTRNLLHHVDKRNAEMAAAMVRTIFAQPDVDTARNQLHYVADQLARSFPKAAELLADAEIDVTAYAVFPHAHWRKIWSTNPLERVNKELKRRCNVVGVFPDDAAVLRLVGAVLLEQHDDWQVADRRYLSEGSMSLIDVIGQDCDGPAELPAA